MIYMERGRFRHSGCST